MKNLAALVLFLVTWKTFLAKPTENMGQCAMVTEFHQEEFFDWFKAASRATALKIIPENYDVRLWELQQPEPKEIKR